MDPQLDASLRTTASHALVAIGSAIAGNVAGIPGKRARYINRRLVDCDWIDLWKLPCGALAIILGILTLVRRDEYSSKLELGLGVAAIAGGLLAIAAGAGLIMAPCERFL